LGKTFTECINDSFTLCDYALVSYVRYKYIYVPEVKPNTKLRLKVLHHPFLLLLKTSYLYVKIKIVVLLMLAIRFLN